MAIMKKIFLCGAAILAMQSAVLADELDDMVKAVRAADIVKIEEFLHARKYTAAEYDQLIKEADTKVSDGDNYFILPWVGMLVGSGLVMSNTVPSIVCFGAAVAKKNIPLAVFGAFLGGFAALGAYLFYRAYKTRSRYALAPGIADLLRDAKKRSAAASGSAPRR